MAPKLNRKDYMFMDRKHEKLSKQPGEIGGLDFLVDGCEDCEIVLMDHVAQIFVDYCKRCTIVIGAVATSAFLRNCESCRFKVACGQLRTRDCVDCDVLVQVVGQPIVETSRGMRFGPILTAYGCFESHLEAAGLSKRFEGDQGKCRWTNVYDFSPTDPPGGGHWSSLSREEVEALSASFPAVACAASVRLPRDTFPGEQEDSPAPADPEPAVAAAPSGAPPPVDVEAPTTTAVAPAVEGDLTVLVEQALTSAALPGPATPTEVIGQARKLVAEGATLRSVEACLHRLRARERAASKEESGSTPDDLPKALLDTLSSFLVYAPRRRKIESGDAEASTCTAAGLAQAVQERLRGSEGCPACQRAWLVASRRDIPVAAEAAQHLVAIGAGRLLRVETELTSRGVPRLLVECGPA